MLFLFYTLLINLKNCVALISFVELYGFDILIDENLKPWLLEVNLSPSLNCESPLDVRLKSAMLADLLSLIGIPAVDPILRPSSTSIRSKTNQNLNIKLGNVSSLYDII